MFDARLPSHDEDVLFLSPAEFAEKVSAIVAKNPPEDDWKTQLNKIVSGLCELMGGNRGHLIHTRPPCGYDRVVYTELTCHLYYSSHHYARPYTHGTVARPHRTAHSAPAGSRPQSSDP